MYGGHKNIKRNLLLYFFDGISFTLSVTFISITTIIPFFLEQLGASTIQIGMAAALVPICTFITQPLFGSLASRVKKLSMTFAKILFLQRISFLVFAITIPLFPPHVLIRTFLFAWGVFNLFVGSYSVFFAPLILKLLPPDRRGGLRGIGFALGSLLSLAVTAIFPVIFYRITFPYDFMLIFVMGSLLMFVNAAVFALLREHNDIEPRIPMGLAQYTRGIFSSLISEPGLRALILTCTFLVIAISLLPYYTVYAIRIFSATDANIATLAALAVASGAVGHIVFGFIVDKRGPVTTVTMVACLTALSGALALFTNSLTLLFVAWAIANFGNSGYFSSASLLLGEIGAPGKLPLYAGVLNVVALALSAIVLLVLAPVLERIGFNWLFITILACGVLSLAANVFVFRRHVFIGKN
ncbi:MAG: MFS transporter [Defluviitaleaceae bacterium]|nr:MFS transporter [Defluviitaleaceae bacterium]